MMASYRLVEEQDQLHFGGGAEQAPVWPLWPSKGPSAEGSSHVILGNLASTSPIDIVDKV